MHGRNLVRGMLSRTVSNRSQKIRDVLGTALQLCNVGRQTQWLYRKEQENSSLRSLKET
jgi:hypothetical protein